MAKAPVVKVLSVDDLVLDAGTQSRVGISEVTVDEYVEVLAAAGKQWPFPNLDVFHDGNQYLVADGFTRTLSASRHGRSSVPCNIHQGTAWDALLFGMGANQTHGLRPSQADKRHAVEMLLDSGKKLTQQQIADIVGVARRTVSFIVSERKPANAQIAHSDDSKTGDPFGESDDVETTDDPFGEGDGTDSDGSEADTDGQDDQDGGDRPPRNGREAPEKKRTAAEEFKLQQSKTIKTTEALMRAFDDLDNLRKNSEHERAISECKSLLRIAKNWK